MQVGPSLALQMDAEKADELYTLHWPIKLTTYEGTFWASVEKEAESGPPVTCELLPYRILEEFNLFYAEVLLYLSC